MTDSLSFAEIAVLAGRSERTARGWPSRYDDFPPAGARTEAAIREWLAAHPRIARSPSRPVPDGGPDRWLTLSAYAIETGRRQYALYQYARKAAELGWPPVGERHHFPRPRPRDGLYRLADLVDWDATRPGQGV